MADEQIQAPDVHDTLARLSQELVLNRQLAQELVDLRGRLAGQDKALQDALGQANSHSARASELEGLLHAAQRANAQLQGDLVLAREAVPAHEARAAKLEADLRTMADAIRVAHEKAQPLRPE